MQVPVLLHPTAQMRCPMFQWTMIVEDDLRKVKIILAADILIIVPIFVYLHLRTLWFC